MQKITVIMFVALFLLTRSSFSQKTDSTKSAFHFGGAALVTRQARVCLEH